VSKHKVLSIIGLAAVLAILCVLPFFVREYHVEILIIFLINVILAVSYRLITTTGDWTLCHVVLMGVGAYASALMAKYFGWPFWMTAPLAGVAAGLIGLGIVYPLLRTVGFGFFIASLAVGEFIRLSWVKFHDPFGGPRGMINIPYVGELGAIDFYEAIPYYFMTLVVTLVCVFIMYRIDRSRIGNTFKAVYEDNILAESIGIKVGRYRSLAFVLGSFFAGIAGAFLAHRLSAIDPHIFGLDEMVYLLVWVVVGGTATFAGPIIGVAVMSFLFEWTRPLLAWRPLFFGAILIGFLIFMPGGLESLIPKFVRRFGNRKAAQAQAEQAAGAEDSVV
jgi:branched-chain amino acid transport system permease protein